MSIDLKIGNKVYSNLNEAKLSPLYQSKLGVEFAKDRTKNNGYDEIFFEHRGTNYVAYSDKLNLSNIKRDDKVQLQGVGGTIKLIGIDNELNSTSENFGLSNLKDMAITSATAGLAGAGGFSIGNYASSIIKHGAKATFAVGDLKAALLVGAITSVITFGVKMVMEKNSASESNINSIIDPNSINQLEENHDKGIVNWAHNVWEKITD